MQPVKMGYWLGVWHAFVCRLRLKITKTPSFVIRIRGTDLEFSCAFCGLHWYLQPMTNAAK